MAISKLIIILYRDIILKLVGGVVGGGGEHSKSIRAKESCAKSRAQRATQKTFPALQDRQNLLKPRETNLCSREILP